MINLEQLVTRNRKYTKDGKVADYIPELSKGDGNALALAKYDVKNNTLDLAGDKNTKITIQSIVKVAIYAQALIDSGPEKVYSKIGVKPSSDAFNSITKLETTEDHKPLNPFINAGAIACTSLVCGEQKEDVFDKIFSLVKKLTNNNDLKVNESVYLSEKETGDNNRALAYFMKSRGIIDGNLCIEDVLDSYFKLCAIEVSVAELACLGAVLANNGIAPWSKEEIFTSEINRLICSVMFTCGMYDYSGEFAVLVGLPAKSGVGGGIVVAAPKQMGIAVVGPALDSHGNSSAGMKLIQDLVNELDYNLFR